MRTLKSQRHEKKGRHFSHWLISLSCACLSCHFILTFFLLFLSDKQQQPVLIIAFFLFLQLLSLHPKPFSSQYPLLSGIMQWKLFQPASGIKHVMKTFKPLCNLRVNIKGRQHDSLWRKERSLFIVVWFFISFNWIVSIWFIYLHWLLSLYLLVMLTSCLIVYFFL